jgi:hypothetical protein
MIVVTKKVSKFNYVTSVHSVTSMLELYKRENE